MRIENAERQLDLITTPLILEIGFEKIDLLVYERPAERGIAVLQYPCRIEARGVAFFNIHVGLRFIELSKWLGYGGEPGCPTFVQPIHFLHRDRKFFEWKFTSTEDIGRLYDSVLEDLHKYAIPFFDRYADIRVLQSKLESENVNDWIDIGLDSDRRVTVLAAIYLVNGEKTSAIQLLDNALLERKNTMPVRWLEIKRLRRRIEEG